MGAPSPNKAQPGRVLNVRTVNKNASDIEAIRLLFEDGLQMGLIGAKGSGLPDRLTTRSVPDKGGRKFVPFETE